MSNSTTDHKMSADNPPQESQNLTGVKTADKLAPMTLPDDIELREELEIRLCINGCQQRTAGYNEAKQGKKGLDTDDMERMETIAVNEVMELIATYRKKWEAEARLDEVENFSALDQIGTLDRLNNEILYIDRRKRELRLQGADNGL